MSDKEKPRAGLIIAGRRRLGPVIDLTADEDEDMGEAPPEEKEEEAAEADTQPEATKTNKRKSPPLPAVPKPATPDNGAPASVSSVGFGSAAPPSVARSNAPSPPLIKRPRFSDDPPAIIPPAPAAEPADSPASFLPPGVRPVKIRFREGLHAVRAVLPNISGTWVSVHLKLAITARRADPIACVIRWALDLPGGYPISKNNVESSGSPAPKPVVKVVAPEEDYRSHRYRAQERRGVLYEDMSQSLLFDYFPTIPVHHIIHTLRQNRSLLVPTFFALDQQDKAEEKPYRALPAPRNGRQGGLSSLNDDPAPAEGPAAAVDAPAVNRKEDGWAMFDEEKLWLVKYLRKLREEEEAAAAKEEARTKALADGLGIECGCCFGEELLEDMFQCAEGHLFCRDCLTRHAAVKLGEGSYIMTCMDTSMCPALFPESELARVLSEESLRLYHRLKQADEIEMANIEGLESCPFCPFSAIIDNPNEKLFRCQAPECRKVSCRACKRKNHLPKSCEEAEAENAKKANKLHAVEDAMSAALIRNCPNCKKPFIREEGCNKMTCPKCGTVSCYVCREVVHNGYDHFDRNPANYRLPPDGAKCKLWDNDNSRDNAAIVAARDAAQEQVRRDAAAEGVQLVQADINVEAPPVVQIPRPGRANRAIDPAALLARMQDPAVLARIQDHARAAIFNEPVPNLEGLDPRVVAMLADARARVAEQQRRLLEAPQRPGRPAPVPAPVPAVARPAAPAAGALRQLPPVPDRAVVQEVNQLIERMQAAREARRRERRDPGLAIPNPLLDGAQPREAPEEYWRRMERLFRDRGDLAGAAICQRWLNREAGAAAVPHAQRPEGGRVQAPAAPIRVVPRPVPVPPAAPVRPPPGRHLPNYVPPAQAYGDRQHLLDALARLNRQVVQIAGQLGQGPLVPAAAVAAAPAGAQGMAPPAAPAAAGPAAPANNIDPAAPGDPFAEWLRERGDPPPYDEGNGRR